MTKNPDTQKVLAKEEDVISSWRIRKGFTEEVENIDGPLVMNIAAEAT